METTYKIIISKDGEIKKTFENQEGDAAAFGYMLRAQGQSIHHALKFEGWKVEQINEQTKESEFWKPYF